MHLLDVYTTTHAHSHLSQYPHEKEVLLPPLTGLEALGSDVDGEMLVVHSRLSINLSAQQTLEQVLSRRRKMLMDMAKGIELDIKDVLSETLLQPALSMLRNALAYGALSYTPEWYSMPLPESQPYAHAHAHAPCSPPCAHVPCHMLLPVPMSHGLFARPVVTLAGTTTTTISRQ